MFLKLLTIEQSHSEYFLVYCGAYGCLLCRPSGGAETTPITKVCGSAFHEHERHSFCSLVEEPLAPGFGNLLTMFPRIIEVGKGCGNAGYRTGSALT